MPSGPVYGHRKGGDHAASSIATRSGPRAALPTGARSGARHGPHQSLSGPAVGRRVLLDGATAPACRSAR
ncbi:MAG: hypothetical protein AVDCRST_MAG05-1308 [uncultured Rubrobacteraceae bacterium]|uniref:Uncharacterized protein n=1 Tax=uncultured Rubrobacteraceae bacterium TaxID=349277 RepID=A0A6J4RXL6_9ACTN|nr:MAG: hypothetical protein AVDCRST_MAG05-1308 [uncultured Rubrobacteraceae bacterium]